MDEKQLFAAGLGLRSPWFVEEEGRLVVRPVRSADEMMGSLRVPGTSLAEGLRRERDEEAAQEERPDAP